MRSPAGWVPEFHAFIYSKTRSIARRFLNKIRKFGSQPDLHRLPTGLPVCSLCQSCRKLLHAGFGLDAGEGAALSQSRKQVVSCDL